MDDVPKVAYSYPFVHNLISKESNECPRLIILDGANIIVSTSREKSKAKNQEEYSISSLVSLIRIFTAHNFEVVVSMQKKYLMNKVIPFGTAMLKVLYKNGIVADVPNNNLDDLMMLELARVTDGLVLSKDRFRDHVKEERYQKIVEENTAFIKFRKVEDKLQHKMTNEGHYIATHIFEFPDHKQLYSTPENPNYELSQERRTDFTEERKQFILDLCDKMLLKLREWENNMADEIEKEETVHQAIIGSIFTDNSI